MARARQDDEGFTLIELMVVVLIIAILIAIAIPTFVGAREKAQARAAQGDLRAAIMAGQVWIHDNGNTQWNDAFEDALPALEPAVQFEESYTANSNGKVAVEADSSVVWYGRVDASGRCWYAADQTNVGGKVLYGRAPKGCADSRGMDEIEYGASWSSVPETDIS